MRSPLIAALLVLTMVMPAIVGVISEESFQAEGENHSVVENTDEENHLYSQKDPIDTALKHVLRSSSSESILQVIVQFEDADAGVEKANFLRNHGLIPLHRTKVVPAIFASGPAEAISELAHVDEIKWVEWNSPIEYLMNQTIDTISARGVWDREVLAADRTTTTEHIKIRGDGVTVVVLDSGIDATHPDLDYNPQSPANPSKPNAGDKVIYNAKLDQGSGSATPNFAWIPLQNTDTTSGHGTHCAGTVAGNGDASADNKLGVAPNAWIVGLSMGEAAFTIDEYSALEYVYELSEPGSATQEAWNIRVVTNSWGPGFPFDSADSNDLTVQIIDKISWDNNVAVIFANGNDGGDGGDDRSNIFAKVPSAIGVAAANRNGVGMSSFSSRGDATDITTWPDVAAPGVDIWSAAARATMIGGGTGAGDTGSGELDYYYLAISGTSMATPHVAGLVALMFQAAPSLQMSNVDEDLTEEGDPSLHDPTGFAPPATASRPIHEAELILKLTADRIVTGENLPDMTNTTGVNDRTLDYAQGYGMVNAERAVAVALALQQFRDVDGDGQIDDFEVSVWDVINRTDDILYDNPETRSGDQLKSTWDGEFAVFSSGSDFPPASSHRKEIWVPKGTTRMMADMNYQPLPTNFMCPTGANLRLALDKNGDMIYEEDNVNGVEITFQGGTSEGAWWAFDVQGNAAGTCLTPNPSTTGPRSPYDVELSIWLQPGTYTLDRNQSRDWVVTGLESSEITFEKSWYLHVGAEEIIEGDEKGIQGMFDWMQANWYFPVLIAILILVMVTVLNENTRNLFNDWRNKRKEERVVEAEIFEAEMLPVAPPIDATLTPPPIEELPVVEVPPTPPQNSAPGVIELVEVVEEVVEEEIVEAEIIEAEVIIDSDTMDDESDEEDLDVFLADFDEEI